MKNRLKSELKGVHIDEALKRRILSAAAEEWLPGRQRSMWLAALAAAAVVVVMLGLTMGVTALRTEHEDRSSTVLSTGSATQESKKVWIAEGDGLYHADENCAIGVRSVRLETARAEGRKACSGCVDVDSFAAEGLVWMTGFGSCYHTLPDCSGMKNAVGVLHVEAVTLGKKPCPVCTGEAIATAAPLSELTDVEAEPTPEPTVDPVNQEESWATMVPESYEAMTGATLEPAAAAETEQDVSGMTAESEPTPKPVNLEESWATMAPENYEEWTGTTPEPVAAQATEQVVSGVAVLNPENGEIISAVSFPAYDAAEEASEQRVEMSVWTTDYSAYFHLDEHCSGMEGAYEVGVTSGDMSFAHARGNREAVLSGKQPCPVCMNVNEQIETAYAAEEMSVWSTVNGTYYHAEEHCSGMHGANASSESEAGLSGKQPCPVCVPENEQIETAYAAEEMSVWSTANGTYYHAEEHCSGMHGARESSEGAAMRDGKTPCPVCLRPKTEHEHG